MYVYYSYCQAESLYGRDFFWLVYFDCLIVKTEGKSRGSEVAGSINWTGVLKVYSYWMKSFHSVIKINSIDKIVKPQRVIRTKAGKKNQVSILFTPSRRTELIS
jgi:hypothetical protein